MHKTPAVGPTPLARRRICRIDLCGCQGVHVTIGAVTLRLPPGGFEELHSVVCEAMELLQLEAGRDGQSIQ